MLPNGIQLKGPGGSNSHVWPFGRDGWKAGLSGDCDQCLQIAQGKQPQRTGQQLHGPLSPNFRSHGTSLFPYAILVNLVLVNNLPRLKRGTETPYPDGRNVKSLVNLFKTAPGFQFHVCHLLANDLGLIYLFLH